MMSKSFLLFLCLLSIALTEYSPNYEEIVEQWNQFKITYDKSYTLTEEAYRFEIFVQNLAKIEIIQQQNPEAVYGITQFADLSEEEFKATYLSLDPSNTNESQTAKYQLPPLNLTEMGVTNGDNIPANFDWRNHSAVTPVKDQGMCGSCWAFSAIANIEGQYAIEEKKLQDFSEQELVDCDDLDSGCNGGYMWNAFTWLAKGHGLEPSSEYPYVGFKRPCSYNPYVATLNVTGFYNVSHNETVIAETLYKVGPLATGMNAKHLQFYHKGIYKPIFCNPDTLDHGVTLVGYGSEEKNGHSQEYWIVKNSWGPMWGEKGYFKIVRGEGTCGINTAVCTAQIEKPKSSDQIIE